MPVSSSRSRTSLRNACSKAESPQYFVLYLLLGPVGMLALHSLSRQDFRQLIESKTDLQPLLRRHPAVSLDLFLQSFLWCHGSPPNRRRANASAPWTTTSSPRAAGTIS